MTIPEQQTDVLRITADTLRGVSACSSWVKKFQEVYPNGFPLSYWTRERQIQEFQGPFREVLMWAVYHQLIPLWSMNGSDLHNANLCGVCLSDTDLCRANLSHTDLSHAYLSHTDLSHANLSNADLRFADLNHADLRYADLSKADLRFADLTDADLSYAKLVGADLRGACMDNTKGVQ